MFLLTATAAAHAKSAEDYYHGAAYRYVEGKIQEAGIEAEEGLRRHPGDAKLRALAEQIRKMQDQQRGNSGNDGNRDPQKNPDPKDSGDEKNDPDKNDGQENPDEDPSAKQPPPGSDGDPGRPPSEDERERPQPGQMSREEAERLLNSFADDEKKEQAERRRGLRPRAGTEQDW